jgi:endo-1,4-beta-xylanase
MRTFFKAISAAILAGVLSVGCTHADPRSEPSGLAEALEAHFLVGAALAPVHYEGAQAQIVRQHFNAVVAENYMKPLFLQPQEDVFEWQEADRFVAFGEAHGMHMTGHTLAWHRQIPDWLFVDQDGAEVSRQVLLDRMEAHITTVMTRYKGRVHSWDVVNEAVLDTGEMRPSKFFEIIGPDWVEHMFRFAAAADPDAKLYYNDYLLNLPKKREAVFALVQSIRDKGVRVDGIGMQQHVTVNYPDLSEIEASIIRFAELGDVLITELDVSVLPVPQNDFTADVAKRFGVLPELNPYPDGLPPEQAQAIDQRFVDLFRLYVKHADKITRVTTWGVSDTHSWRNYWPIRGRTDYPLLFDRDLNPKPAVARIMSGAAAQ